MIQKMQKLVKKYDSMLKTVEEIAKRAPHVIRQQYIMVNGERFDLLSMDNWREDWRKIQYGA